MLILLSIQFIFLYNTRLTTDIVKDRFLSYASDHFPDYTLEMSDYSYTDYSTHGFSAGDDSYTAEFRSTDPKEPDIKFGVSAKGFFFHIQDSYDATVLGMHNTYFRLTQNYEDDLKESCPKFLHGNYLSATAFSMDTVPMFEESIKNKLTLNMPYERAIEQIIPFHIFLNVYGKEEDLQSVSNVVQYYIDKLTENNFHPKLLSLTILTETNTYVIEEVDCTKRADDQELIVKDQSNKTTVK